MEPTITWLDLTARDRDRMRRVLDLFTEKGTTDEMGLGTLRDAFSNTLFPGTSSIQTRLRYVLFIPWLYQRLEKNGIDSDALAGKAKKAELDLIGPLGDNEDSEGVIGARARTTLIRLPSSVYWAALVRWGIFVPAQSQSWYHTHFSSLIQGRNDCGRADDPGVIWTRRPTWHPRLPKPPQGFPWETSFALTGTEADFLRGRLEEGCAGSLLAWMAREGSYSPAANFWDDPDALRASEGIRTVIELARRFSLHLEGAPLLYNLLLAERRHAHQGSDDELIEEYHAELAEWAARESAETVFNAETLWDFAAREGVRVVEPQLRFVEAWSRRIAEIGASAVTDDAFLRSHIEHRERTLKGNRARLSNLGRLLDWSGRVGIGRMHFRWFRVRQLLSDLHLGLEE